MDILNEMTKDEIIAWIKTQPSYFFKPIKKSEFLYLRWDLKSRKIQAETDEHLKRGELLDMKKRDEYARKFNESTDPDEKLVLLKKMQPYETQWQIYITELKQLQKKNEQIDRIYNQMEKEREKENLNIPQRSEV